MKSSGAKQCGWTEEMENVAHFIHFPPCWVSFFSLFLAIQFLISHLICSFGSQSRLLNLKCAQREKNYQNFFLFATCCVSRILQRWQPRILAWNEVPTIPRATPALRINVMYDILIRRENRAEKQSENFLNHFRFISKETSSCCCTDDDAWVPNCSRFTHSRRVVSRYHCCHMHKRKLNLSLSDLCCLIWCRVWASIHLQCYNKSLFVIYFVLTLVTSLSLSAVVVLVRCCRTTLRTPIVCSVWNSVRKSSPQSSSFVECASRRFFFSFLSSLSHSLCFSSLNDVRISNREKIVVYTFF